MGASTVLVLVSALVPLVAAGRANRATSLIHAIVWAFVAWIGWTLCLTFGSNTWNYLALDLTGCAGVAVLGARRPGVAAWNCVAGGLLAVLLMPLAESCFLGTSVQLGTTRTVFLASLLGVTVINYLPTRLGAGAVLLGIGCALQLRCLAHGWPIDGKVIWCVGLAPWAGWLGLRFDSTANSPDRIWRRFRDRYGLIWSLRAQEQFNVAATNAGRNLLLGWSGMRMKNEARLDAAAEAFAAATLTALLKRFGPP